MINNVSSCKQQERSNILNLFIFLSLKFSTTRTVADVQMLGVNVAPLHCKKELQTNPVCPTAGDQKWDTELITTPVLMPIRSRWSSRVLVMLFVFA